MATERENELKELLRVAGLKIAALLEECDKHTANATHMVDTLNNQEKEMARMTNEINKHKKIIHRSDEQMSEAAILMNSLVDGMGKLRSQVQDTLVAAEDNISEIDLRDRVKTIAEIVEMTAEDEMVAEYNRQIDVLRDHLKE